MHPIGSQQPTTHTRRLLRPMIQITRHGINGSRDGGHSGAVQPSLPSTPSTPLLTCQRRSRHSNPLHPLHSSRASGAPDTPIHSKPATQPDQLARSLAHHRPSPAWPASASASLPSRGAGSGRRWSRGCCWCCCCWCAASGGGGDRVFLPVQIFEDLWALAGMGVETGRAGR
ncbi:hypothetical protein BKA80DRAFT_277378 [Phyllosticta citrichinensis]